MGNGSNGGNFLSTKNESSRKEIAARSGSLDCERCLQMESETLLEWRDLKNMRLNYGLILLQIGVLMEKARRRMDCFIRFS